MVTCSVSAFSLDLLVQVSFKLWSMSTLVTKGQGLSEWGCFRDISDGKQMNSAIFSELSQSARFEDTQHAFHIRAPLLLFEGSHYGPCVRCEESSYQECTR